MPKAALSELLSLAGLADRTEDEVRITGDDPVLPTQFRIGAAGSAAIAATGVAVSDLWKLQTGRPQRVHVDVLAAAAALRSFRYVRVNGGAPTTGMERISWFYRVRDGRWVFLHCNFPHHRDAILGVLGAGDDPDSVARAALGWDGAELETAVHAAGAAASFVRTPEEWKAHPQSAAIADVPVLEIVRVGDAPPEPLPQPLSSGARPLSGIRVIDMTRVVAGPTCARTLAEHGAEVLKITRADLPDSGLIEVDTGLGKRAAFLDVRAPADMARMRALLQRADVFSQAYRPGTLAARGLSPEDVAALRPGIVYATLSAWGHVGPWAGRRGYDTIVQAATGLAHASGRDGEPRFLPAAAIDYVSGYLLAYGVLVALVRRAVEGGSWMVRASLAGTGRWIRDRGTVPEAAWAGLPGDLPAEVLRRLTMETQSPFGTITHIGPAIELSETPPHWSEPPVPLGSHSPEWKDEASPVRERVRP